VRDAEEWRRIFTALGWMKDVTDVERAFRDSLKTPSRRGTNLHALLRTMELPAFDGEDPSEPWVIWMTLSEQRRSPWLIASSAEIAASGDDMAADVETLIITRCRVIALSSAGLTTAPSLVLTESLANMSEVSTSNELLRLPFAAMQRELRVHWRVLNKPAPLSPADLRTLAAGGPGQLASAATAPLRRASDRREGSKHVAESVLTAFARQLTDISG
jgi:hypothetical protein